jgi:hypothetical protein
VLGGLGFGLFVDELGKFVTEDNNYFFQPTIALIYVLFVVLFLAFKAIERQSMSSDELLVNAADMLREVILGGATRAEVVRARRLLDRSGFEGPLAENLREAIDSATRAPERVSPIAAAATFAWRSYDNFVDWPWFRRAMWLIFVAQAVLGLLAAVALGVATMRAGLPPLQLGTLVASSVSLVFVLLGVTRLPRSRLDAYRWFERRPGLRAHHPGAHLLAGSDRRPGRSAVGSAAAHGVAVPPEAGRGPDRTTAHQDRVVVFPNL